MDVAHRIASSAEFWVNVLAPTNGRLPRSQPEFITFAQYLRRFGHLVEAGSHSIKQGFSRGAPTMAAWMTQDSTSAATRAMNFASIGAGLPPGVGGGFSLPTSSGSWENLGPRASSQPLSSSQFPPGF